MAAEQSHGRPYVVGPRLSDTPAVDTDARRHRNHDDKGRFRRGNDAPRGGAAKRVLKRQLRLAVSSATTGAPLAPAETESAELLDQARVLFRETRRRLRMPDDPRVAGPAIRHAVNTVLAGFYTNKAGEAGFASDLGMKLLEMAHKCEQRADRSSVQCTTFDAQLRPANGKPQLPPWFTEAPERPAERVSDGRDSRVVGEPDPMPTRQQRAATDGSEGSP